MIRITNIHLSINHSDENLKDKVCKELRISKNELKNISIFKRSIDARKKNEICFIYSIDVSVNSDENRIVTKCKSSNINIVEPYKYQINEFNKQRHIQPLIIGAGPAGLFAGLILAQSGAKPIIIERGENVDNRTNTVNKFWGKGSLNTESNVQFGEGGAGAFSDGKLTTGTKDVRARKVLDEFVLCGAPEEILYDSKPHIGTDKLKTTIKNLRNKIISCGGQFLFNTKLVGITTTDKSVTGVTVQNKNKEYNINTNNIILAVGHSARDTFELLNNMGVIIEQKAFSIGARIEHLRKNIDISQYGNKFSFKKLGAAPYKLNVHLKNGRGVYTFCMCPGGKVVGASSEAETVVTNGMSEYARDDVNSNSALLVGINPSDFNSSDRLAGMYLQRKLEQNAFKLCGGDYSAPVQKVGDFLNNQKSSSFGNVLPTYKPGTKFKKLDDFLPDYICNSMRDAIPLMNNRLHGFSDGDALLTGIETRSSSPIRIMRNDGLESVSISGLYPCGEGAGYAGGIVSAAVDGIKCAEQIINKSYT